MAVWLVQLSKNNKMFMNRYCLTSLCLAENIVDPPEEVLDYLKGPNWDGIAFSAWLLKVRVGVAEGKADLTLEMIEKMSVSRRRMRNNVSMSLRKQ